MAEPLVYHWKHGWIPLTHAAALSKAKGNSKLADKYVRGTSTHHLSGDTHGKSARQIHGALGKHARIMAHPGSFRDEAGHHITGTDTRGRKVGVFVPGNREAAQKAIDNIHAGRPAFGTSEAHGKGGPQTAAEAFRMDGPELRTHATNGSTVARTELDRRAAKHAKPGGEPQKQAKSLTPAQLHAQNKGGLKIGDEVSFKGPGGRNVIGTVQGFDAHGRPQVHSPGVGVVTRSGDQFSKNIHPATRAAHERSVTGDFRKTPTATLERALGSSAFSPRSRDAMQAELARRGLTYSPGANTPGKDFSAENARIAPHGHTIESRFSGTKADGTPQGFHTQRTASGERVGSVIDARDGSGYRAMYNGQPIGTFPTRGEAHAALADKYRAEKESAATKAAISAASRDRKSSEAVKGLPAWQSHQFQSDGTRAGDAAASKIKQSFKSGNHTVHIETPMTKEQTRAFLSDVHSVLLKSNMHDHPDGVTFHVPSGDKTFRSRNNSVTGGYVRQGQRTVFVNPKVANGSLDFGSTSAGDQLMSARAKTNGRQYVITHELGHVLDHANGHTSETSHLGSRQVAFTSPTESATALHRSQRGQLSRYGQSRVAEGYAEAYAQWIHGGPGSNAAADAFAAQYGWKPPKWYREGRK